MPLVTSKDMLAKAYAGGYAIGAFNVNNMEIIQGITEAAKEENSPVILQVSGGARKYANPTYLVKLVEAALIETELPICLHLDHGDSFELCKSCIDGGFSSVMIDGSKLPFAENIALTRKVADYAHERGIPVEAELGAVGKVADDATLEGADHTGNVFTNPDQAAEFIDKSKCDFLAVSIGNTHGLYRSAPSLDFALLAKIRDLTSIPLVLHGGSGTPVDQLKKAVSLGIAKVNVASEIGRAFTDAYIKEVKEKNTWWAVAKKEGKDAIRKVVGNWVDVLGSGGKA